MLEMRPVYSSHINRVGYDEEAAALHVEFSNGSHVLYHDVPLERARSVLTAPSIGQEIWRVVRGRHSHSYLRRVRGRG